MVFFRNFISFFTILTLSFSTVLAAEVGYTKSKKETSRFYIKQGKQFSLCREIKKILDEPENADYGDPFIYIFGADDMFFIPKKYKNFRLAKWKDVPIEDAPKYMTPGKILSEIEDFKEMDEAHFQRGKNYVMQKTKMDLNHDGKNEVIVRFRLEDDLFYYNNGWEYYVADAKKQTRMSKQHNHHILHDRDAKPFWYKGKVFKFNSYGTKSFGIEEPIFPRMGGSGYGTRAVCNISLLPQLRERASKGADLFFRNRGLTKLKYLESIKNPNEYQLKVLKSFKKKYPQNN